jgi:hypothetical protein
MALTLKEHPGDTYEYAHVIDPALEEQLRPPTREVASALGARAIRERQHTRYEIAVSDIVAGLETEDPRQVGTNAAEGHVPADAFTVHKYNIDEIDKNYAPYLTKDFYERFGIPEDLSLSEIVQYCYTTDGEGDFAMSPDTYLDILEFMHGIHELKEKGFEERLPDHIDSYAARLAKSDVDDKYVAKFRERVAQTRIVLDDGFDTLARGGGGRHYRNRETGERIITMAPIEAEERDTLMHEFTHTLEDDGLYEALGDRPYLIFAITEAVAMRIENHLTHGRKLETESREPNNPNEEVYDLEGQVLDLLTNGGAQPISIHEVIEIDMNNDPSINEAFLRHITEAFPDHPDLLDTLEALVRSMYVAENVTNDEAMPEAVAKLDEIRDHYKQRQPTSLAEPDNTQ